MPELHAAGEPGACQLGDLGLGVSDKIMAGAGNADHFREIELLPKTRDLALVIISLNVRGKEKRRNARPRQLPR